MDKLQKTKGQKIKKEFLRLIVVYISIVLLILVGSYAIKQSGTEDFSTEAVATGIKVVLPLFFLGFSYTLYFLGRLIWVIFKKEQIINN